MTNDENRMKLHKNELHQMKTDEVWEAFDVRDLRRTPLAPAEAEP